MRWKLKDYLARHNVTAHQLALESKLSLNSVYPAVRGQAERVSLATLDRMLAALDRLTGQQVELGDLLEREVRNDADDQAALLATGTAGLAEALDDLERDIPPEELNAWFDAFERDLVNE